MYRALLTGSLLLALGGCASHQSAVQHATARSLGRTDTTRIQVQQVLHTPAITTGQAHTPSGMVDCLADAQLYNTHCETR